jgi:hypothetical protein
MPRVLLIEDRRGSGGTSEALLAPGFPRLGGQGAIYGNLSAEEKGAS